MNKTQHEPTEDFISRLEDTLRGDYRRLDRIGTFKVQHYRWQRWLQPIALVMVSLLVGAASVTIAQRIENSRQLELLREKTVLNQSIAAEKVKVRRSILETAKRHPYFGVEEFKNVDYLEAQVVEAELALSLAELALDALPLSDGDPMHDISSPLLQGRDFYTESLQLELNSIQTRENLLNRAAQFAERQTANVDISQSDVEAMSADPASQEVFKIQFSAESDTDITSTDPISEEIFELQVSADRIRNLLALRQSFLEGEIDDREAELQEGIESAGSRIRGAEKRIKSYRPIYEDTLRRFEVGLLPIVTVKQADLELKKIETELRLAEIEVELLMEELANY